jgi:DNA polymerase sigma
VNFIKPTEQDIAKRQDAVKFVETILNSVEGCEDCKTVVFGSFANDLMLPSSDVDLMIRTKNNSNDKNLVLKLTDALKLDGSAQSIKAIPRARVPIVKFSYRGINIDVSFNNYSAARGVELIRSRLADLPALRPLVLVVKQFLAARQLNETFSGGVGSFLVVMMVSSFLKV